MVRILPSTVRPRTRVRALLAPQAAAFGLSLKRARRRCAAEEVHRLRALARRLRAGLLLFRRELGEDDAAGLAVRLGGWVRGLGAARDVDVWLTWLGRSETAGFVSTHPAWPAIVAQEAQRQEPTQEKARRFLRSEAHDALLSELRRVVGPVRLSGRWVVIPPVRARRKLRRLLRQLCAERDPLSRESLGRVHEFRRECRRARYWAELLALSLGRPGARLREELRALADELGLQRDADLVVRRLSRRQAWWTDAVRHRARRISKRTGRKFTRRWRRFRRRLGNVETLLATRGH
ncbi:MAG TPA: CHAD domain-containing protein [Opitutaceae bacterium]|nr:CHAD domain-containing protein [Opitutaceae bacterium]HND60871.1 CHAD domain-containing protein [Opitutaceae bacterium]